MMIFVTILFLRMPSRLIANLFCFLIRLQWVLHRVCHVLQFKLSSVCIWASFRSLFSRLLQEWFWITRHGVAVACGVYVRIYVQDLQYHADFQKPIDRILPVRMLIILFAR